MAAATAASVSTAGVTPYDILSHHTLSELLQPKQSQFFVDEKGNLFVSSLNWAFPYLSIYDVPITEATLMVVKKPGIFGC